MNFNTNYIYGLNSKLINKEKFELTNGFIKSVNYNNQNIPLGTKCIIANKCITKAKEVYGLHISKIPVVIPFSIYSCHNRLFLQKGQNVKQLSYIENKNSKNLYERATFKQIEDLDHKKIDNIISFSKEVGPLTLLTNTKNKKGIFDLKKFLKSICKEFKIIAGGQVNGRGNIPLISNEIITLAITILNIEDYIPIFNKDKVDGLFINVLIYHPEYSKQTESLQICYEFNITLSNFEENVLKVDGQNTATSTIPFNKINTLISEGNSYFASIGNTE